MERLFCYRCGHIVAIERKSVQETYSVRGEGISISADVNHCQKCGEQIFHEELDRKNLDKVYAEFRKRRGVVSPERIQAIRAQYDLSQRALGRLLRLGEITIHRYENGSLPSDAHNELLVLIEDPTNVKRLLDEVGSDLSPNEETNLRSRLDVLLRADVEKLYVESAQKLLGDYQPSIFSGFTKFNPGKVKEMVALACNQLTALSKTKLMKMLFYSDFLYFKENGISISGLRYAHLPYGPAVDGWNTMLAWLERERVIELTPTEQDWDLITSSWASEVALKESEL
ncbi:MAG: type II toxin-antitoxin system MqsA family antitoxin, partial [Limnochordia bacterium]|nr:type II toxin-antitoxin system MqsA family antitoxin [Limnochordia bacterium]